ncbi:MAG: 3-deoxy-manno-octulosonate cytidylyltransferase [Planctomycetes bacterium]|nr:3-deoxy-manno-octulosonate cytidylyltransferase [Planctomycetota bacterium]
MTRAVLVLPARYGSTRLPAKPLLAETGKYLIQHVYERAAAARGYDRVIVATDDERIASAVRSFGGEVRMTSPDCPSGTDRVAEVARGLAADVVVNLQGDEPEMDPEALARLLEVLDEDRRAAVATLACPIRDAAVFANPAAVKVVLDETGGALYFSRAPVPHPRDGASVPPLAKKHLGVYAFRRDALLEFAATPPTRLEETEKLEQLRLIGTGRRIAVEVVDFDATGIDTPGDYRRFVERWKSVASGQ